MEKRFPDCKEFSFILRKLLYLQWRLAWEVKSVFPLSLSNIRLFSGFFSLLVLFTFLLRLNATVFSPVSKVNGESLRAAAFLHRRSIPRVPGTYFSAIHFLNCLPFFLVSCSCALSLTAKVALVRFLLKPL